MNNITFGQYVPGNSWLYKLDPRTKVLLSILLIVVIFIIPNLYGMLIALGMFVVIFLSARISAIRVIKGLRPILFLLCFTFVLQLIYNKEGDLLYTFPMEIGLFQCVIILGILIIYFVTKKYIPFKLIYSLLVLTSVFVVLWQTRFNSFVFTNFDFDIYEGGLNQACFVFIRIVIMIGITTLLTISTMSTDINNGLEWLLMPLKYIGIPVSVISMTFALTLRFIPTLLEESKKIMNAQASRGVDFNEGSLGEKVTQIISLLVPMFVISFKRAEDLSNAMEARGYVIGAERTRLDELKFRALDVVCFVVSLAFLAIAIGGNFIA